MAQIEWDDSFSVNNAEIDDQHKKWIEIYNNLDDSMLTGKVEQNTGAKTFEAMLDYARYHFSFEEEYMQKIHYPDLIKHHRMHKDFDNLMYGYYRDIQEGTLVLGTEIIRILKKWLLEHIVKEDKNYALFLEMQK